MKRLQPRYQSTGNPLQIKRGSGSLQGYRGSAVGGGNEQATTLRQDLSSEMAVSSEVSMLPYVSPAVFASMWPGVRGSPGHLAGAVEGAYHCSWTGFTAVRQRQPELEWGGSKLCRGGGAGRAGEGVSDSVVGPAGSHAVMEAALGAKCYWAVPACQAPCRGSDLWLGQPSFCCTHMSPGRWAVTPPTADVPCESTAAGN